VTSVRISVIAAFLRNSILTLVTISRVLAEFRIFINCIVTIRGLAGLLVLKALTALYIWILLPEVYLGFEC